MKPDNAPPTTFPDGRPEEEQPKWRQDFPIDVEADEYGARRDFTKFMVLTSLAFACGQVWIALLSFFRRGRTARQRIAAVAELERGKALSFHYPTSDDPCLLIRLSDGTFQAYSSQCPHLTCPVRPESAQRPSPGPSHPG